MADLNHHHAELDRALVEIIAAGLELALTRIEWPVTGADDAPLVVSVSRAAELLGVSDETIYTALDAGHLPEIPRFGRRRLIPLRAIHSLVEQSLAGWHPEEAIQHFMRLDR